MKNRYIEDVLPLGELNKYAQKGARLGSLNAMHPYFARRPLTASRAMTMAALLTAPKTQEERSEFEKLLIGLSSEEWPKRPDLLERVRDAIRQNHGGRTPRVLDPFAGGGSMPIEALRLGCDAYAMDLNPVAYLTLTASLVYPQKIGHDSGSAINIGEVSATKDRSRYDEQPDRIPTLPGMKQQGEVVSKKLVDDVIYWAGWVRQQAEADLAACYPTDTDGAVPVAYVWANALVCPHCGGETPLIKRRWLQTKEDREPVAFRLIVDKVQHTYTVEIVRGPDAQQEDPEKGTMRGATVECIYCGTPTERDRIVTELSENPLSQHLLAVVLYRTGVTGRDYRAPKGSDMASYRTAANLLAATIEGGFDYWGEDRLLSVLPDEPTPPARARSVSIRLYGITEWGQLFNARQSLALITFGKHIRTVRELLATQDVEYAKAVTLYLAFILAKQMTYNSKVSWWMAHALENAPTMPRHDIQFSWDYSEANPFSGQASSWDSFVEAIWRSIRNATAMDTGPATVQLGSATHMPAEWTDYFDAIICDPPYYDSVTYGDLTDFFYAWHKRIVGDDYPEAFVTELTPKDQELVQEAVYHGGTNSAAKQYYEDGMAQAFSEMHRVLRDDGIAVIMFAHKKSSAWETLVNALIRAGFQVTASWPLNTEGRRLQAYRAVALASSIYLVCRKRNSELVSKGYLEDIEVELRGTIRLYLERFWAAGIGGADFFMSAIGPALSVYSRYETVERYDGQQVTVSEFLNLVRHEVAAFAIERIVGQAGFSERLDALTQFYLLWHWGYNTWDVPDGEALLLSTAVGIELQVLIDRFRLVARVKDKMRLADPWIRKQYLQSVTERVEAGGTVPLVDVMQKACILWDANQQDELAALIANRGNELWPVAQAMVELLPKDNPERRALLSMLGTRHTLENRAQTWVNTHQQPLRPIQTTLWQDEPARVAAPDQEGKQ